MVCKPTIRKKVVSLKKYYRWEVVVACLRSSVVVCPAPSLLVERDIQYRCERTRATVFVGDTKSIEQFMRIREHCPSIKTIIHIENDGNIIDASVLRLQDALAKITPDARFDSGTSHSGDPALIYFTSGTSGPPKMVQHNRVSYPLGTFWSSTAHVPQLILNTSSSDHREAMVRFASR